MLILTRTQVAALLSFDNYIEAVERAFLAYAEGRALASVLMHVDAPEGEFHIKAGGLLSPEPYFALKANSGFFHNRERYGLPNIQGLVVLASAANGRPLAVMDSAEITIQRTGAATAIAARYLARPDSQVCTVCGCGTQGRVQLRAMTHSLPIRKALVFDLQADKMPPFASAAAAEFGIEVVPVEDLPAALAESDVCVTCTPSRHYYIRHRDVPPGMFLAAVGADSPEKQELDPRLLPAASVFGDLLIQCAEVGEFHHALAQGLVTRADFRGELGELVTGRKPGRTSHDEITIFDSTGTALQDAAGAAAIYARAQAAGVGVSIEIGN